jgi:hypothetical protein
MKAFSNCTLVFFFLNSSTFLARIMRIKITNSLLILLLKVQWVLIYKFQFRRKRTMSYMDKIIFCFSVLWMLANLPSFAQNTDSLHLLLTNQSTLTIYGSSNISKFKCKLNQDFERDSLHVLIEKKSDTIYCKNAGIVFEVNKFHCGHEAINKDFRQTLRSNEYPTISLSVDQIYLPDSSILVNKNDKITADISIELAGVIKDYNIEFDDVEINGDNLSIIGSQQILMSEFNIDPPLALLGLIKTNNELSINFEFELKLLEKANTKTVKNP